VVLTFLNRSQFFLNFVKGMMEHPVTSRILQIKTIDALLQGM
jgi:hypothetical protein